MSNKPLSALQKKDNSYNWHPYHQHQTADVPIVITKGKDALLWDEHGKQYIDAIGSWWCNPHGHCNEHIANAITEQVNTLEHVLFGGFTHPKVIELSEQLLNHLPNNQAKLFYSDNGSTAVEVAIKMALQYHYNKGEKKNCIIALEDAYHGDTFAAMASSGIDFFTLSFKEMFIDVERIPVPTTDNIQSIINQLKQIFITKKPAAFIFECLVQGSAGMRFFDADLLDKIIALCKENQVLCIADEVMTGFGRTGKLFASLHLQEQPDFICLSKALTGGFVPMAVTSTTQEVYDAFLSEDISKTFFHGHTFMANPTACAAALASLELTLSNSTKVNIDRIHQAHIAFGKRLQTLPQIKNLVVQSVILRFEVDSPITEEKADFYGTIRNALYHFYIKNGVILRPVGNAVYLLPPYCITNQQLQQVYQVIWDSVLQLNDLIEREIG